MAEDFVYMRWIGDTGGNKRHEVDSYIERVAYSWTPMAVFGTAVEAHSLCNWGASIRVKAQSRGTSAPALDANVDKKAIIYFRDPDTSEVLHFSYPSPIAADIEELPSGLRIKNSAVAAIVGYLSTLNSKAYTPLYGLYYQRA